MAVVALLYVLFAVLAFRGRNWARVMVTVMTVGFTLLLLSGLVTGAAGDAGLAGRAAGDRRCCCVGGTVLMYLPASAAVLREPAAEPDPAARVARRL